MEDHQTKYDPPSYATATLPEEYRGQVVRRIERSPTPGFMRIEFVGLYKIKDRKHPIVSLPEFHLNDRIL